MTTPATSLSLADSCLQLLTVFDRPSYSELALSLRDEFQSARPFPHVVIDNFLPTDVAGIVAAAYPDPDDPSVRWKTHSNDNVSRKFVEDARYMSPAMRLFAQAVTGRQFLLFLETLSGIDCLIPDPYFIGGGAMVSARGDFLNVHADFNWHHKLQAHRRLNALLYLTRDWQAEWGGDLELWPKDMSGPAKTVSPQFNRLVIFSVTDDANHGQPRPLATPPGVYRRVFSIFCYTSRRDDAEWNEPHFTLYRPEKSPYGMSLLQDYQKSHENNP